MAFQPPNHGQERQNRKLLEQLEEQKKRLRMAAHGGPIPAASAPSVPSQGPVQPPNVSTATLISENQHMTPAQRAALQHANANSVGYFITQDSSFGNLILPVLPRFEK